MDILLGFIVIALWCTYILFAAERPVPSDVSMFELRRRARTSHASIQREERLKDVAFLHRVVSLVLLMAAALSTVAVFGWLWGVLIIAIATIVAVIVMTQPSIVSFSRRIHKKVDPLFVKASIKWAPFFQYVRELTYQHPDHYRKVYSRDELLGVIKRSPDALTSSEKKMIISTLAFSEKRVKSVMTARGDIKTVAKDEFLGPIVLDELHKLGHSRLPVVDGGVENIVGMLYLRDLLTLDVRNSKTAEELMEKKLYYIQEAETLDIALSLFLKIKHHLLIVLNQESEVVGLLSLEDVIEQLIGHKITDEDDIIE